MSKSTSSFPVFNAVKGLMGGKDKEEAGATTDKNKDKDKDKEEGVRPASSSVVTEGSSSSAFARRDSVDSTMSAESKEEVKKESGLAVLMGSVRQRYVQKGLIGEIVITQLVGIATKTVSCEVTEDDLDEEAKREADDCDLKAEKSLVGQAAEALNSIDAIIRSLLNRSKAWDGLHYSDSLSISQDVSVGFYLPVFMTVGFSITIEVGATVSSLSRSRKREKEDKELKKTLKAMEPAMAAMVEEVIQQGFGQRLAIKAVRATDGVSTEAALHWAIANNHEARASGVDLSAAASASASGGDRHSIP